MVVFKAIQTPWQKTERIQN